jgi:hypothetical protein
MRTIETHYVVAVLADETDVLSLSAANDFSEFDLFLLFLKIVVLLLPSVPFFATASMPLKEFWKSAARLSHSVVSHSVCMWASSRHSLIISPPFCSSVQGFKKTPLIPIDASLY